MSINKEDQLKFGEGKTTEPLTILEAGVEELEFGPKHVVHIKVTIEGYNHFLPSDGLIKKLKEENVDIGDKITIEKVAPSEKYKYGYFAVKVVEKGDGKPQVHKSVEKFEKQFEEKADPVYNRPQPPSEPDAKLDVHELALRVETLEKEVATLKKNAIPF